MLVNQCETVCDINSSGCKGHSSVYYSFHCWNTWTRQTSSNIYTQCCLIVKTHHLAEHQLFPPANRIATDLVWSHFCQCTVCKKPPNLSLVAFFGAQGKHTLITMFMQGWSDKEFHIIWSMIQFTIYKMYKMVAGITSGSTAFFSVFWSQTLRILIRQPAQNRNWSELHSQLVLNRVGKVTQVQHQETQPVAHFYAPSVKLCDHFISVAKKASLITAGKEQKVWGRLYF